MEPDHPQDDPPGATMPYPLLYEHRSQPLLTRREFARRMLWHGIFASTVLAISLGMGVLGYHYIEQIPWVDALLNAAMILGGMGPVDTLHTAPGKLFASFYALYSGMIFLVVVGILIAPLAHRLMHRLHLESDESVEPLTAESAEIAEKQD
jgi:hypothetical protein